MPIPVSYMGTKKQLAPRVRDLVKNGKPGPVLDVFSGMCAVAYEVSEDRQVWTNDVQHFAHLAGYAHFCSETLPPSRFDSAASMIRVYSDHVIDHIGIASSRVQDEEFALNEKDAVRLSAIYQNWNEACKLRCRDIGSDATLFRDLYAGSYFGLSQAIEIDGIRSAIEIESARRSKIKKTFSTEYALGAFRCGR